MSGLIAVPDDVTIAITSCGRLDLLEQTISSFRRFHSGGKMVISEDSGDPAMSEYLRRAYPEALILDGPERTGLMRSIDRLYARIHTPYVLHCEDDWGFNGPVDFDQAKKILAEQPKISVVCVRVFRELKKRHRAASLLLRIAGAEVRQMPADIHPQWYGWSPNPGFSSMDFWRTYQPVSRFGPDELSAVAKKDGWFMVFLLPGVARHIGQDRHVSDPTLAIREKSFLGRLRRLLRMQWRAWRA